MITKRTRQPNIEDIISNVSTSSLANLLNQLIVIANDVEDTETERWAKLELNGYLNNNPVFQNEDQVPRYRFVPGQYFDVYGRPLKIDNPELIFINEYALRQSISELEEMIKDFETSIAVIDENALKLIRDYLKVEVHQFRFAPFTITGVFSAIRTQILERAQKIKKSLNVKTEPESEFGVSGFHPRVVEVAGRLFEDGHYRQAILDTYIALVEYVKEISGRKDDGVSLMQNAFSPNNPVIKVSDDRDEQQGLMWLFTGAVMGIRNPKAHKLAIGQAIDKQRALEWLGFASVLFRTLDDSTVSN